MNAKVSSRPHLVALIVCLLALGMLYAAIVPPLQSPDEPQHLVNLIQVAGAGRPLTEADRDEALEAEVAAWMARVHYWYFRWEPIPDPLPTRLDAGIRPPLYYLIVSAVAAPFRPDSLTAWLLWGRAVSIVLATATAALIYLAVREIEPADPHLPIVAAAFAGLLPLAVYLGASVSADNLANFLAGALFYLMARAIARGLGVVRALGLAAILIASFGAFFLGGFLTKLSSLFLVVPAVAIAPLAIWARRATYRAARLRWGVPIAVALGLVAGYLAGQRFGPTLLWYLENRVLYPGMLERVARRDFLAPEFWSRLVDHLGLVYRQFWGSFGWLTIPIDTAWIVVWTGLVGLAALGGLLAIGRRLRRGVGARSIAPAPEADPAVARARAAFGVGCLIWLAASAASLLGLFAFAIDYGGGLQGRYLLADLGPIAYLLALGWRSVLPVRLRSIGFTALVAWFLVFNLAALTTAIVPAFYISPYPWGSD